MAFLSRIRCWLAGPELQRAGLELAYEIRERLQTAYQVGRAHGEIAGRNAVLSELEQVIQNRRGFEVGLEDIEVVRQRMVH